MHRDDLERLAAQVSPQSARAYAIARGWIRDTEVNGGIALFNREGSDLDQLIIPIKPSSPDYARRIVDVVANLSDVEQRPQEEILNDLLMPDADIVRYQVVSPETEKGDLPLEEGIRILDGAKRSLLASACSVLKPVKNHPRMSLTESKQLLDACRLRQTERGSYTLAIACPLRGVEEDRRLIENEPPFGRRTTELLLRSAARLVSAIEADNIASIYDSEMGPVISGNFCEAVLRMQPAEERSSLNLSVTWASTLPLEEHHHLPSKVTFQHDYFPLIEDIYKKLRPSEEPATWLFIGYVDTLNGNIGDDGRVQGETRFLIFYEDEIVKARTELSADDYQKAIQAHATSKPVKFNGVLHLGRRVHRITDVNSFSILGAP